MKQTLAAAGAALEDLVQIQLFLKNTEGFDDARSVFFEYLMDGFPARMTSIIAFLDDETLCQMTGIAYKPQAKERP